MNKAAKIGPLEKYNLLQSPFSPRTVFCANYENNYTITV